MWLCTAHDHQSEIGSANDILHLPISSPIQLTCTPKVEWGKCFHCGFPSYMLSECKADKTVAGRPATAIITNKWGSPALELCLSLGIRYHRYDLRVTIPILMPMSTNTGPVGI